VQITDQQFIDAMRTTCDANPTRQAPGAYMSNGHAYCVIGKALASIEESLCPKTNALLADALLLGLGCSSRVARAGMLAQYLNDQGQHWETVGKAFTWALEHIKTDMPTYVMVTLYRNAGLMPYVQPTYAYVTPASMYSKGGMITTNLFPEVSMTTDLFNPCASMKYSVANPLMQKDHALTA
jgi:hypothetical protein